MSLNIHPHEILVVTPVCSTISYNKEIVKINVHSNVIWHVTSDSNWCHAFDSQLGDGIIEVECEENYGKERKAILTIKGLDLNSKVSIRQKGKK
jgi:hypothetical protein